MNEKKVYGLDNVMRWLVKDGAVVASKRSYAKQRDYGKANKGRRL